MPAGEREAGTLCARCGLELVLGEATAVCRSCGSVHHGECWKANQGCASYECSRSFAGDTSLTQIRITPDELAAAVPLPTHPALDTAGEPDRRKPPRNRTGIAAFVVAILGIPLFGLVTGLVAMVIACIALAGHSRGRRDVVFAVLAIFIGLFDVIGWAIGLSTYLGTPQTMVALDELTLDPESLKDLPERISRAMRANVIIESAHGLGRSALGSGVVLKIDEGIAHIVTNRHTVDKNYTGGSSAAAPDTSGRIQVIMVGQPAVSARVEWIAPHSVDLAIISAPVDSQEVQEASWNLDSIPRIGDQVFAIGNPHGLGWTHSAGDISQVRRRTSDGYTFRIIQTTAAINPGNSGGGL